MKPNPTFLALSVVLAGVVAVPAISAAQHKPKKPTPKPTVLTYNKDIAPAMNKACAGCHTGPSGKAGLDLSTYAGVMKGKIVMAGHPEKSKLCGVLHGKPKLMPPKNALDAKTIGAVELWVKQGAKEK
jgi:hypothetical protein